MTARTSQLAAASYEATLGLLAADDERVVVLTAENRAAIRNLPTRLGNRFVDVGICEQTMIGVAAGMAVRGRIPVVHALATFLTLRAFEFIRTDLGIAGLSVKLVGGVPGVLSEANGPTHQALDDLAVMRAIPGMSIVCPADEADLCAALPGILAAPGPVYVRHNPRPAGTIAHAPFVLGRAEPLVPGSDVAILALGYLVPEALEASATLAGSDGLAVGVMNMRSLAPIDEEAVLSAARSSRLLVTVEDHFLVGGLYQSVTEILVRHRLADVTVLPIGFDARFFAPGLLPDVLQHERLNGPGLAGRIRDGWARTRASANHEAPEGESLA
jgi:transketolase